MTTYQDKMQQNHERIIHISKTLRDCLGHVVKIQWNREFSMYTFNFVVKLPMVYCISVSVPIDIDTDMWYCETALLDQKTYNLVYRERLGYYDVCRFREKEDFHEEILRLFCLLWKCRQSFLKFVRRIRRYLAGKIISRFIEKYKGEYLSRPGNFYYRRALRSFSSYASAF